MRDLTAADTEPAEPTEPIEPTRGRDRRSSERGASLVEYALLVALIAVVCVAAVTFFGEATSSSFSETASEITSA